MAEESAPDKASEETQRSKERRQELLRKLGDAVNRTIVAYFTSQKHPVTIDQTDADMLEEFLRHTKFHNGLCLLLDTLGGDAISAERIVRICNIYSNNNFEVFVARRAKSAGTIIALGSRKILMGETSALGRIDPQIVIKEKGGVSTLFPAHVIITSFDELLNKAETSSCKEAYLQQISNYDINQIEAVRRQFKMAEDIAVKCLKQGMMKNLSEEEIKERIAPFITPVITKAHSRDIFYEEASKVGLNIELVPHDSPIWEIVSDYYDLAWDLVSGECCKLIESADSHFSLPWQNN